MRLFAIVASLTVLAAACGTADDAATQAPTPTEAPAATAAPPATATPPVTTVPPATDAVVLTEPEPPAFRDNRLSTIDANLEGSLLGVATGPYADERIPRFNQLEADAGRQLDIGHVFHAWDRAIPTEDDLFHIDEGRILMISWNGTDTLEIQSGLHDEWITQQATAVRDLGEPVLLRWLWEMDGQRRISWVHSPEDFVGAWLHIRSIFDEVGATNADFVWCPNAHLFWEGGGDPDAWYPGDEHVDWLCADGYNWEDTTASPGWVSLDQIFSDFVEWAAPRNLPIMLGETGSNEGEAGAKAAWFASLPDILQNDLPEVDAVVYFDVDFRANGHPNWRVDTTQESYEAWVEFAQNPWLNP